MNTITGLNEAPSEVASLREDLETALDCLNTMQSIVVGMLSDWACESPTEAPANALPLKNRGVGPTLLRAPPANTMIDGGYTASLKRMEQA